MFDDAHRRVSIHKRPQPHQTDLAYAPEAQLPKNTSDYARMVALGSAIQLVQLWSGNGPKWVHYLPGASVPSQTLMAYNLTYAQNSALSEAVC